MIINYRLLQTIILKFLTILGGGAFNIPTVEAVAYSLYDLSAKTVDKLILSKNLYVSDSYGNDIIAIKGNPHRSFKTIEAAVSAATVGDLIYVFKDDYVVNNTISKNGVDFYFEADVNVTGNTTNIFINTEIGNNIYGLGNFYCECFINFNSDIDFSINRIIQFNKIITTSSDVGFKLNSGINKSTKVFGNYLENIGSGHALELRVGATNTYLLDVNIYEIYNNSASKATVVITSYAGDRLIFNSKKILNLTNFTSLICYNNVICNVDYTWNAEISNCIFNCKSLNNLTINNTIGDIITNVNNVYNILTNNSNINTNITFNGNINTFINNGGGKFIINGNMLTPSTSWA